MTIARPPISGGSAAATRLRKNQSASANRMGNAISSARARSSDTILLAARSAAAPPPSSTPDQPRKARETRSTVFVLSAEGLSAPTANAERPSREIIARDPLLRARAPFRRPLVERDPELEGQGSSAVRIGRLRVDRPQALDPALVALAHRPERSPDLRSGREEQLEEALVAQLPGRLALGLEPLAQGALAGRGQGVLGPRPSPRWLVPALDQTLLLEPAQLGIDLPVARCPEEPRRHVH